LSSALPLLSLAVRLIHLQFTISSSAVVDL
jgi:hypothetical protein